MQTFGFNMDLHALLTFVGDDNLEMISYLAQIEEIAFYCFSVLVERAEMRFKEIHLLSETEEI
jgi:hypothetical protein